jgi:hypothetical protein
LKEAAEREADDRFVIDEQGATVRRHRGDRK